MKKRFVSLLISACMVFTLLPFSALTAFATNPKSDLKINPDTHRPDLTGLTPSSSNTYKGAGWSYNKQYNELTLSDGYYFDFTGITLEITYLQFVNVTVNGGTYYIGHFMDAKRNASISNADFHITFASSQLSDGVVLVDGATVKNTTFTMTDNIAPVQVGANDDLFGFASTENCTFSGDVIVYGAVNGGHFSNGSVENHAKISGTAENPVTFDLGSTKTITNDGTIEYASVNAATENNGAFKNSVFTQGKLSNTGVIENCSFSETDVVNESSGSFKNSVIGNATFTNSDTGTVQDCVIGKNATGLPHFQLLSEYSNSPVNVTIEGLSNTSTIRDSEWHIVGKPVITASLPNADITSINGYTLSSEIPGIDGAIINHNNTVTLTPNGTDNIILNKPIDSGTETPDNTENPDNNPPNTDTPSRTTYSLTVKGGTVSVNGASSSPTDGVTILSLHKDDTIKITLRSDLVPDNMTFDYWDVSDSSLFENSTFNNKSNTIEFQMPTKDLSVEAMYRNASISDSTDSSSSGIVIIASGVAVVGIGWLAYNIAADLYAQSILPQGTAIPETKEALAVMLWQNAGKPEVAAADGAPLTESEQAQQWVVANGLMVNEEDGTFHPDKGVGKFAALNTIKAQNEKANAQ